MSKSYFINNVDSYLGKELVRQLTYTEEEGEESDVRIISTRLDPQNHEKPKGVKKVLWVI